MQRENERRAATSGPLLPHSNATNGSTTRTHFALDAALDAGNARFVNCTDSNTRAVNTGDDDDDDEVTDEWNRGESGDELAVADVTRDAESSRIAVHGADE